MDGSPLEFPSDYPVKVMGRHTPEFRAAVLAALADRLAGDHEVALTERISRDGGYVSLTALVRVGSRAELDAIYRELHATGLVLYAL
jgi:putative lipoic acid-binding regulatory protein